MCFVMHEQSLQPVAVSSLFRMGRSDALSNFPHLNMHEQFPMVIAMVMGAPLSAAIREMSSKYFPSITLY